MLLVSSTGPDPINTNDISVWLDWCVARGGLHDKSYSIATQIYNRMHAKFQKNQSSSKASSNLLTYE